MVNGLSSPLGASLCTVFVISLFYFGYWNVPRNHTYGQKDPLFPTVPDHIRMRAFPPPFPNGWFKIAESGDVPIGKVRYVRALGCDFAVFRGMDGKARVIHAFCPHMGANLAGGQVKENHLECPFHGWKFSGDGVCEDIPYLKGWQNSGMCYHKVVDCSRIS